MKIAQRRQIFPPYHLKTAVNGGRELIFTAPDHPILIGVMAGIYIHIPFCRKKCSYCNFFSVASSGHRESFIGALLKEIADRRDYLGTEPVETVYIGGGTPSLLTRHEMALIFEALYFHHPIIPGAEITLEANPDDISMPWLEMIAASPVNRLSIGVQSFHNEDLHWLERVHDGHQAAESVALALKAGFANLTVDLIYGIPGLTDSRWRENLDSFFSLKVPHLSAYALTVEEKTPLNQQIRKGLKAEADEEQAARHFRILLQEARKNDFIHYEISNFAKEGFYSKHNSLYWLGGNYLGLGPSAHSYNGISRQWNVSSLSGYIGQPGRGWTRYEKETLTPLQRHNEYIMTSLRTIWGCDTHHITNVFGKQAAEKFIRKASRFIEKGWMIEEQGIYTLSDAGKFFADGITAELFLDERSPLYM